MQQQRRLVLSGACRTLHLAFKSMSADEVFDQLVLCLVKSIRRYDPCFHTKVPGVAEVINSEILNEKKKFCASELNRHLEYDATSYLRYLGKRLFLVAHQPAAGFEVRYSLSESWPPPPAFFHSGSIGLSYFISKWFRYYLVEFINSRMGEIESKEGVFQLFQISGSPSNEWTRGADHGTPHSWGNLTNPYTGLSVAADLSLCEMPVDIGTMNLEWVNHARQKLFKHMAPAERHLLYCYFSQGMNWEGIAATFDMSVRDAKKWHASVLAQLQQQIQSKTAETGDADAPCASAA